MRSHLSVYHRQPLHFHYPCRLFLSFHFYSNVLAAIDALSFCSLQDEKNQVMITNAWLQLVRLLHHLIYGSSARCVCDCLLEYVINIHTTSVGASSQL